MLICQSSFIKMFYKQTSRLSSYLKRTQCTMHVLQYFRCAFQFHRQLYQIRASITIFLMLENVRFLPPDLM